MEHYIAEKCLLCGSEEFNILQNGAEFKAINSDGKPSQRVWKKLECKKCGLIREGNDFNFENLENHYEELYTLNSVQADDEHMFFRNGEKIPRNKAMAEEIRKLLEENNVSEIEKVFEIGSGQGNLIKRMGDIWPGKNIAGVELSRAATAIAQKNGINVIHGDETRMNSDNDLVVAVTVFEHVPNPVVFLKNIARNIRGNGYLVMIQPVQNGNTYDIFYTDHLHHFNVKHVEWFANKAGFKQVAVKTDPWFAACTSVHLLQKTDTVHEPEINFIYQETVHQSVAHWISVFNNVNEMVKTFGGSKVAVYGMSEVLRLLHHFSDLKQCEIVMGIDDYPERHTGNFLGIPVKKLDDISEAELEDIDVCFLTMNHMYYPQVTEKCRLKGLKAEGIYIK